MDYWDDDAVAVLERTPATFRAFLGGLPEVWTTPNEGPGTFSAFDTVGHLIHGERTDWIPRARVILVAHDVGHLAQTARVLAKQYREAVGPWRAYLPVMDR